MQALLRRLLAGMSQVDAVILLSTEPGEAKAEAAAKVLLKVCDAALVVLKRNHSLISVKNHVSIATLLVTTRC